MNPQLVIIQKSVDRRVSAILADRGDWLCRRGCDDCCRRLAAVPELTEPEWNLLRAGFDALAENQQQEIYERIAGLGSQQAPITCPFLDLASGSCRVYTYRPVACRTYGFYMERDEGLYCDKILNRVEQGSLDDVVWGNHESIAHGLSKLGPTKSLPDWFTRASDAG